MRDSNSQPPAYKAGTLPIVLIQLIKNHPYDEYGSYDVVITISGCLQTGLTRHQPQVFSLQCGEHAPDL